MPISKPDFNLIFASQAPSQDLPAAFNNYARGWDEARKNNGKPTIKQFNYLIQQLDLKALWMIQNGAALPFDENVDYAEGAFAVKDGSLQQFIGGVWKKQSADKVNDASGETQQQVNYNGGSKWHSRVGGYKLNERVVLTNGDIVKSTIDGNTNDPNVDMTGWGFVSSKIFKSYSEMAAYPGKNGQLAETVSYHEGLGYGGAKYKHNGSVWVIQPSNATISIEQFGAKCGQKPAAIFNQYPEETTDNTAAIQAAYDYCAINKFSIICENLDQCFFLENTEHLKFTSNVRFDFGRALFFSSLELRSNPKTAPIIEFSNIRDDVGFLQVTTHGYVGYAFLFSKVTGDNQALTIKGLKAYSCRRGAVVLEPECVNRLRIINCDFASNYYEGVYFKSFDTTYGHSAPVFIEDTIANGNGPQDWILNTDAQYNFRNGGSISVRDTPNDVAKGQVYFRGISGLDWRGGQISNHGNGRCNSLLMLDGANMVTINAADVEDFTSYASDGTKITIDNYMNYVNDTSGAAIVCNATPGLSVSSLNLFKIQAPAVLKLMNNPGAYHYGVSTASSGFAFNVWDISSPANGFGACSIHPYVLANGMSVSPTAFANSDSQGAVSSLIHHEQGNADYTVPWSDLKYLWQNGQLRATASDGYNLKYLSNHDQPLVGGASGHLYNEYLFPFQPAGSTPNKYAEWVFVEFTHGQTSTGRLLVQCLDASNAVLASTWTGPSENATHYPVSGWFRLKVPTGTRKVRFGFVNSENYDAAVRTNFWGVGTPRCPDWHLSVYLVHDGNGALRNKFKPSFTACKNDSRNMLIHQANTVSENTVNLTEAATLADVITAVNELAASDNAVKTTLKNAGVIKTT